MRYIVKKIREKSEIESCETFFIDQYMWNSRAKDIWMDGLFGK